MNRIKIGSLFAGIGGFELGLERAIPGAETVWQVEQNEYCQKILTKHWPNAKIYDDVRKVNKNNLEPIDILCGGFPCQDISLANQNAKGLQGEKSGLWFEMLRLISELRPKIAVLENVAAVTIRGLSDILRGLSEIGYDAEWQIISAKEFGAPHLRKRWFCVAYPNSKRPRQAPDRRLASSISIQSKIQCGRPSEQKEPIPDADGTFSKATKLPIRTKLEKSDNDNDPGTFWDKSYSGPKVRRMDDGVSTRLDRARLRALGNAIVPQCSEYIGHNIYNSGLLDD